MTLKKLTLKAGVNRENTRYTNENGWYVCDKVRFRQGTPEKIGGWVRVSDDTYLGVCRALFNWATLSGAKYVAVGTNLKYYILFSSQYNDITPLRTFSKTSSLSNPIDTTSGSAVVQVTDAAHGLTTGDLAYITGATAVGGVPAAEINTRHVITVTGTNTYTFTVPTTATSTVAAGGGASVSVSYVLFAANLSNPFDTTNTSTSVTVHDTAHGASAGDYVTFSGATTVGGLDLNNQYAITSVIDANTYVITASSAASSTVTGGGGTAVVAAYQISVGLAVEQPLYGWGAGAWGSGTWGVGTTTTAQLRLWSQSNFGEDLIFAIRGGSIYYWSASSGLTSRGVALDTLAGASDVPVIQNKVLVSDVSRFVFALGCNDLGSATQDPMLIRWSDQEDATNWTPSATNQAGSLRLSTGSQILTAIQARQEVLVWTDAAVYSLQYIGAPIVWGATLLGDNTSLASPNGVAYASGKAYWMGLDKFYVYDGTVKTLKCDLRRFVFENINHDQFSQVYAGTNEGFSEIWWFYCSEDSTVNDRYVVFNYAEEVWYYGTMGRTAWLDTGLFDTPQAATYNNKLVYQESGVDDNETATPAPVEAYIESAEFDIDDGDHFGFVWRILPDVTFDGSTAENPTATMTLIPMKNSGSGYNSPTSVGGSDQSTITRTATVPIEQFTGQIYVRVRGRQMILRMESTDIGVTWQLGSPRIDIRQDGRR